MNKCAGVTPLVLVWTLRNHKVRASGHMAASGSQSGNQSWQKQICLSIKSEYRCDRNSSVWDEGQGWSCSHTTAAWTALGERARRWLGEGPEGQRRAEASCWKLPGTAIWGDCGRCLRWEQTGLHKPHSKIISAASRNSFPIVCEADLRLSYFIKHVCVSTRSCLSPVIYPPKGIFNIQWVRALQMIEKV